MKTQPQLLMLKKSTSVYIYGETQDDGTIHATKKYYFPDISKGGLKECLFIKGVLSVSGKETGQSRYCLLLIFLFVNSMILSTNMILHATERTEAAMQKKRGEQRWYVKL